MLRLGILLKRTLVPAAVCALALAACGSQHKSPTVTTSTDSAKTSPAKPPTPTVYIYSSLPRNGPEAPDSAQIETGIRFALRETRFPVAGFRIKYLALDDSIVSRRRRGRIPVFKGTGWNAHQTVKNAELAARNPWTVAYIGDLDSGATMLSLPILNQAGIAQLTPGSGYPGLTDSYDAKDKITQLGEPGKYYPQGSTRTLLRLIPSDVVQASAALDVLHAGGCQRFSAWEFAPRGGGALEATSLFNAVINTAPKYGMYYYKPPALPSDTRTYATYVDALSHSGAIHCAVLVGRVTAAAVALTAQLRGQLPVGSTVVGTSGFCTSRWLRGISTALVKNVAAGLYCTTPARPVTPANYPRSETFIHNLIRSFRHLYHRDPRAYNYYGYLAAELVISALQGVGPNEDPRVDVIGNLFAAIPSAVLSTYTFNASGDVESNAYGVDSFAKGAPAHYRTVTPDAAHLLTSAG